MVPKTARPTRQVSPTMRPRRLRMAEMRCRVRSMPARLSSPNSLTRAHHVVDVLLTHLDIAQDDLAAGVAGLRQAPQVKHYLQKLVVVGLLA